MSVDRAMAILETGLLAFEGERSSEVMRRALAELTNESPEEARRRYERDRKAARRAAAKAPPDPGVPVPVPDLSRTSPGVSQNVPDMSRTRDLSSSPDLGSPSPSEILVLSGDLKPARARARKAPEIRMPDPKDDPQGFDAFVSRWKLPLSRDMSQIVDPEAKRFMLDALAKQRGHVRWDWAWKKWQASPYANGGGSRANGAHPTVQPPAAIPQTRNWSASE